MTMESGVSAEQAVKDIPFAGTGAETSSAGEVVASIDIGTTAIKGVLVGRDGVLRHERTIPLTTMHQGGYMEQDPESWWTAFVQMCRDWDALGVGGKQIRCVAFSGQMQDLIAVDSDGAPLRPAILYSDSRAGVQAESLLAQITEREMKRRTGNHFDGTFPLAKMAWMREHEPDKYDQSRYFLFGSKDYVILKLTGKAVTDPTTASTVGLMDAASRQWVTEWTEALQMDAGKLPAIIPSVGLVGTVTPEASRLTGLSTDTRVLAGAGDAGSSTLGAGVMAEGDMYVYLGTTGWVAAAVEQPIESAGGIFHLAHPAGSHLIAIAPLLNAGSVHQWAVGNFAEGPEDYRGFEQLVASSRRERNRVLFLPYLAGERCPVQDPDATGCYVGLTGETTRADLGAAALEGVSFAIRQVRDLLLSGQKPDAMNVIGGGGKSEAWMQILADICSSQVLVPADAQFLPALGVASLGFVHLGWSANFAEFKAAYLQKGEYAGYAANRELDDHYEAKFSKYKQLYAALQPVMAP